MCVSCGRRVAGCRHGGPRGEGAGAAEATGAAPPAARQRQAAPDGADRAAALDRARPAGGRHH
eukprot:1084682-Rhodomonas_salina.1